MSSQYYKCYQGKRKHTDGYVLIKKPEHHQADHDGYVFEHRLVYEQYYNCCLLPWVLIHHIDENPQNNNINNLKPVTRKEHNYIHKIKDHTDKKCSQCNSDKTYIHNRDNTPLWQKSKVTGDWLCSKCYFHEWYNRNIERFHLYYLKRKERLRMSKT